MRWMQIGTVPYPSVSTENESVTSDRTVLTLPTRLTVVTVTSKTTFAGMLIPLPLGITIYILQDFIGY